VREFLEKNHKDGLGRGETIKLTVKSLLEVVQTGAKNIEITVMESYGKQTVSLITLISFLIRLYIYISVELIFDRYNRAWPYRRLRPLWRR